MTAPVAPLGVDITPEPVVPLPPARRRPRRRVVAALAGVLVVGVGGAGAALAPRPPPHSDEPVVLPETLLGLGTAPAPYDFGSDPVWQQAQRADVIGAFGGRAYSPGTPVTPQVNLVVNREDVTDDDDGDVSKAGDVEQTFGEVQCTQQLALQGFDEDVPEPERWDNLLICWRADRLLTVSVLVIGVDKAPFAAGDVAAAIDEVWALQG